MKCADVNFFAHSVGWPISGILPHIDSISAAIYIPALVRESIDMNDTGTLCAFGIAILIIAVLTMKMDPSTFALIGSCMLFFLVCRRKRRSDISGFDDDNPADQSASSQPAQVEENNTLGRVATAPHSDVLMKDQRLSEPVYGDLTASDRARISKSNKIAVSELYGRRYGGSMDDALYVHKQRIGDRDRQATINQVRGRRNNVYEPYYRQELSEHASKRWWENDDVLVTKVDRRQRDTIDMGRFDLVDSDTDGLFSQW